MSDDNSKLIAAVEKLGIADEQKAQIVNAIGLVSHVANLSLVPPPQPKPKKKEEKEEELYTIGSQYRQNGKNKKHWSLDPILVLHAITPRPRVANTAKFSTYVLSETNPANLKEGEDDTLHFFDVATRKEVYMARSKANLTKLDKPASEGEPFIKRGLAQLRIDTLQRAVDKEREILQCQDRILDQLTEASNKHREHLEYKAEVLARSGGGGEEEKYPEQEEGGEVTAEGYRDMGYTYSEAVSKQLGLINATYKRLDIVDRALAEGIEREGLGDS